MLEVIESAIHRVKLKGKDVWTRYSYWTKAKDVEFETGKNAEETVANINQNIYDEVTRATNAENALDSKLNSEISRAKNAENTITTNLNTEITRAKNVESTLESKKANIESPTLTGTPKAPTATAGTNTTQIATTAFVRTEINNLINSAPEKADTLKELFDLIEDNTDATDALNAAIGTKANKSDLTNHINNTTVHITATERTNWNDANSKKHTHSNKSILDAITASYTTEEKAKLSGVATGAEVNQNAFSNVVIGTTTISADSKTDTLTLVAGDNVTLTPDTTNDKVTITAKDTTYSNATTSSSGLLSASDKTKLDSVASGANNYVLPTASSTLGGVKTTSTVTSSSGYTACPIISGVPYYKDNSAEAYNIATSSVAGIGKLYTTTGTNTDGSITQSAISSYINALNNVVGTTDNSKLKYTIPNLVSNTIETTTSSTMTLQSAVRDSTNAISSDIITLNTNISNLNTIVGTTNAKDITIYRPNLATNKVEAYTNVSNQTFKDAMSIASSTSSNAIISLSKDVDSIESQINTVDSDLDILTSVVGTVNKSDIVYSTTDMASNTVVENSSSDATIADALEASTHSIANGVVLVNKALNTKVDIGSDAQLNSIFLGKSSSYIYDENGALNFRFVNSSGNLEYTSVKNIHEILTNYLTGQSILINPVSDLNNFKTGVALFWAEDGSCNLPLTGASGATVWWMVISAGSGDNVTVQYAIPFDSDQFHSYQRYGAYGTWGSWKATDDKCLMDYWNGACSIRPFGNIAVFRTRDDSGYAEVQANTFTAYAFNQMSSKYAKENIEDISEDEASKILELRPVKFDYKNGKKDNVGLIAEEVLEVIPKCVSVPDDYVEDPNASEINLPKLDYSKFVPYLIKEVQVLSNEIQKLNNRISKLESDVV